jgi:hypothetical protein
VTGSQERVMNGFDIGRIENARGKIHTFHERRRLFFAP